MNENILEAIGILQEECAEVIQEVSKCRRFGLDSVNTKSGVIHRNLLAQEIGDVLALVDILIHQGVITHDALSAAKANKLVKLHKWSNIFND
jgi:NTP pyrophosphatase (non-canonical NTP hydrolase)